MTFEQIALLMHTLSATAEEMKEVALVLSLSLFLCAPGWTLMHAKQLPLQPSAASSWKASDPRPYAPSAWTTNLSAFSPGPPAATFPLYANLTMLGPFSAKCSLSIIRSSSKSLQNCRVRAEIKPLINAWSNPFNAVVPVLFCLTNSHNPVRWTRVPLN